MLLRGLELLDAARRCREPVQFPAAELVLRSAVEAALRGRMAQTVLVATKDHQEGVKAFVEKREARFIGR